ncbi:MAG TPA: GGDEF domain-containing protein [Burkholderiaceae bacterium]|nr:GGDEF domain-containing protein [Burkholderiaceae bacterium]
MSDTRSSPAETAREVFRQLAQQRKPPTPENYSRMYAQQAGLSFAEVQPAAAALESLARALVAESPNAEYARPLREALEGGHWNTVNRIIKSTLARAQAAAQAAAGQVATAQAHAAQLAQTHKTLASHAQTAPGPMAAHAPPSPSPGAIPPPEHTTTAAASRDAARALKDLIGKTIAFLVDERLGYTAEVVREVALLVEAVVHAMSAAEIDQAAGRLRHFWLKLELRGEGPEPMLRGLHDLVRLMVHNMGDLVVDDQWVKGQADRIRSLLDAPLTARSLEETQRSYKEFVFRQGTLKHTLDEAAQAVRHLTATLIDRMGAISESTGQFSGTIARYSDQIRSADGMPALSGVLERLLADTQTMHLEISATHQELSASRDKVIQYEARVRTLQAELAQMSEMMREDPLTRSLNRRGLEQQFMIEESRADRRRSPLCLAVLDVDNFKQLNDRLGHSAGDDALKHLAAVVRETLRPSDSLARYGGEEFVILLPDTSPEDGEKVMIRVQRELTRRFFMHNNERVLITFSAGIAVRQPDEPQEMLIGRADRAMYEAKRAGKNRVQRAADDIG